MDSISLSPEDDASLLLGVLTILGASWNRADILSKFKCLHVIINTYPQLEYTRLDNILSLLVLYTYPGTMSIELVGTIAAILCGKEHFNLVFQEAITDLKMDHGLSDQVILDTTTQLIVDTRSQVGLFIETGEPFEETLFNFMKAKILHSSKFTSGIHDFSPLFDLIPQYSPFTSWFNGVIRPYNYYWDNYGSLSNNSLGFEQICSINSHQQIFVELVKPLQENQSYSDKVSIQSWMHNVLIPVAIYNGKDFKPILQWLFHSDFRAKKLSYKYELWNKSIRSIIESENLQFNDFSEVIRYYLAACYYYSIKNETSESISSVEVTRIYDLISDTLKLIKTTKQPIEYEIQMKNVPRSETLEQFITDPQNPLVPLFEPTGHSVSALKRIIEACQKLYPMNKLTISKYLELKYNENNSKVNDKKREITRILSNLNGANWNQLLTSARIFRDAFVEEGHMMEINRLIVERFLFANLFDNIIELTENFELPASDMIDSVFEKLWDSFTLASNFNEKIGRLSEANQCIGLLETLMITSSKKGESIKESYRNELIGIKHLFKAMANLKNFRIVLGHNQPFTPHQLITKFRPHEDSSESEYSLTSLATLILELNPKSYLAFEKLYKIINDLMLYFKHEGLTEKAPMTDLGTSESNEVFNKLKAACIESALVDNNFQFAYKQSKQLFEFKQNLDELWLTFYQVGKYISPEDPETIEILTKQREILSLSLENLTQSSNTRAILKQWEVTNSKVEHYYTEQNVQEVTQFSSFKMTSEFKENIGAMANDILNEATTTTNNASEKLSSMIVSGLGWAIGAKH